VESAEQTLKGKRVNQIFGAISAIFGGSAPRFLVNVPARYDSMVRALKDHEQYLLIGEPRGGWFMRLQFPLLYGAFVPAI